MECFNFENSFLIFVFNREKYFVLFCVNGNYGYLLGVRYYVGLGRRTEKGLRLVFVF